MLSKNIIDDKVRQAAAAATITSKDDTTQTVTFTKNNSIKSFEITRVGDNSKFFGFGVIHRINLKLVNVEDDTLIKAHNTIKVIPSLDTYPSTTAIDYDLFPTFHITEVNINETTFEYSITAYDILNDIDKFYINSVEIDEPYSIGDVVDAVAAAMGVTASYKEDIFNNLIYPTGANLEGTETFKEILDAIAEATQTIYYINSNDVLVFKRLDYGGDAALKLDKNNYISLSSKTNRRLQTIASVTQLGDNYSASTTQAGTTQYVRDNPFWELREDIAALVDAALVVVGNATISQFEMTWRGNPALEIGDKISVKTVDNEILTSYLLDDTFTFDGGLSQKTQWNFEDSEETDTNPTNLGDVLKQTYAKVDKANKQIDIMASELNSTNQQVSALQMNTDSIAASVSSIQNGVETTLNGITDEMNVLTQKVASQMTSEQVSLQIQTEMQKGVDKITTSTGYTFDENGLTIEKTGSEMTTTMTEDGMKVLRDDTEVLKADNQGVTAYNLHAKTYLIIGNYSRFEDYEDTDGNSRTGCFWIGM